MQCGSLKCGYAIGEIMNRGLESFEWHFSEMASILIPVPSVPESADAGPFRARPHLGRLRPGLPVMCRYFFR